MDRLYTISEVAAKLGLATKTLRRWEETGKFVGSRTLGGQRRYSLADLQILDAIKHGTISGSSELLNLTQASALFGVTEATFIRWENEGKIHPLITAGDTYYPRSRLMVKLTELRPEPQVIEPRYEPISLPPLPPPPASSPLPPVKSFIQPEIKSQLPSNSRSTIPHSKRISPLSPILLLTLNLCTTVFAILLYHLLVYNRDSSPIVPQAQGQVQGSSTTNQASLTLLDSILEPNGNLKPKSLATASLSLIPSVPPTSAVPGALYFDAGSQTLKLFTDSWTDLPSRPIYQVQDTNLLSAVGVISKGTDSVSIPAPQLTPDSHVTVTFNSDYSPAKKYWLNVNQGSFTLRTDFPVGQNANFTYLILAPKLDAVASPSATPISAPSLVDTLIR